MKWCQSCRRDNESEAIFCSYCGASMTATAYTDATKQLDIEDSAQALQPVQSQAPTDLTALKAFIYTLGSLLIVLFVFTSVLRGFRIVVAYIVPFLGFIGLLWLLWSRFQGKKYIHDWVLAGLIGVVAILVTKQIVLFLPFVIICFLGSLKTASSKP